MSGRLLVTYSCTSTHVATTLEYLTAFARYSSWDVSFAHVTRGAELDFDLDDFDAVLNSYCARHCIEGYVSAHYVEQLRRFRGVKIMAVQDEYENTHILRRAIQDIGFHVILTCVPQASVSFVYPKEFCPGTQFETVLTGYVPENMPSRESALALAERPIVIGYRGGHLDGRYGRLGFEKGLIGQKVRAICEARGIPHDIEWDAEKRLYGRSWYSFLRSCRVALGSESGSNVFDFDGSIARKCAEISAAQDGRSASYEQMRPYTEGREHEVEMGQISPRIFEAAAAGTAMVLFEGSYSNAIEPWTHYIPLKKDFSNIDDVLAKVEDLAFLAEMADRAYDHLIASGKFSYRTFVSRVDAILDRMQRELGLTGRARLAPKSDPFANWWLIQEFPTDQPRPPEHWMVKELLRTKDSFIQAPPLLRLLPLGSRRRKAASWGWQLLQGRIRTRL